MDRVPSFDPANGHRLVVLAAVVNRRGEVSERFVEAETFDLWRIAMGERHRLSITSWRTLLWLEDAEFTRHARLFERQGPVRDVARLCLSHFDPDTHRTHHTTRFVACEDLPEAAARLKAHLWRPQVREAQLATTHGRVVGARALPDGLHAA